MTKAEIIEELEQLIVAEEVRNMRLMDALSSALDYIQSSEDKRAEMERFFKDNPEPPESFNSGTDKPLKESEV